MVFCKTEHAKKLDRGAFPGCLGSMHLQTMAAKAWSFAHAGSEEFRQTMEQVLINAKTLSKELQNHGFRIVSGGTDTHLLVVDLRNKNITGHDFQHAMDAVGITINKNMIPFDTEKPTITSGVRIGLTSTTQRGLKAKEITEIAEIMNDVANNHSSQEVLAKNKKRAAKLIASFPLYPAEVMSELV